MHQTEERPQELEVVDPEQEFNSAIKVLLYYQHKINDIAAVATRFLGEARHHYNRALEQHQHMLRTYAIANLKRNKDGEIKGKNFKTIAAGGGVFFRQKPASITFNKEYLPKIKEFIERYLPDKADVIVEKTVYEVPDKQELIDVLQQIADARAHELFTKPEEITVGTVKAIEEIYSEMSIEIEDADPFHFMYIGTTKGTTFKEIKANLSQAIDGSFGPDQDEEEQLLIEELSD